VDTMHKVLTFGLLESSFSSFLQANSLSQLSSKPTSSERFAQPSLNIQKKGISSHVRAKP